jgi:hypothetical protein
MMMFSFLPQVFGLKTLVTKYVSVALCVASGLYGGNEGMDR